MAQPSPNPGASRTTQLRAGEVIPVGEKTWVRRGHAARGNPAGLPRGAARLYALIGERVATSALARVSGMSSDELASTLAVLVERSLIVVETEVDQDGEGDLDFTAPEILDRLRDEAERSRQAEESARLKVEAERRAKEEAEAKVRAEADAKARAEASARANAAALARLKAQKVERVESDSEINAREGALERAQHQARSHADTLARAETEAHTRAEALRRAEAEAAARMAAVRKLEQEMRARMAALAKLEAERKQKADAATRDQAEAVSRLEAERRAREEAEARAEAERRAREEAEALAREQAEATARAEAERRARAQAAARSAPQPVSGAPAPLPASSPIADREGEATGPALPGADAPLQPLSDVLEGFDRKASTTLWDTADARMLADQSIGSQGSPLSRELGMSITSLADEVQRALEEAEARDRLEQERRRPARPKRNRDDRKKAASDASLAGLDARGGPEPSLPAIRTTVPDEDPAVLEARRLEREAEEQRLLAEEQARQRAREATEIAARARAEREKSERRLEREHEQVQARAQALARERVDVEALRAPRPPRPAWVRYAVAGGLLAAIVGLPEVIPYSGPIPDIERQLTTASGQPVTLDGLHFSLVPTPGFRIGSLTIGTGDHAIVLNRLRATPRLGSLFSGPLQLEQVRIASASVPLQALERIPVALASPARAGYGASRLLVDSLQLGLPAGLALPASGAQVDWSTSGTVEAARVRALDGSVNFELTAAGGGFGLQVTASRWQARPNSPLLFQSLQLSGRVGDRSLDDGRFTAELAGGSLKGTLRATPSASAGVEVSGTAQIANVDAAAVVSMLSPAASAAGTTDANVRFELAGKRLVDLPSAARASASFVVRQGWVGGIDLVLLIRDPAARGGRTVFDELSGTFSTSAEGQSLRQLKLVSGPLGATGTLDIAGDGRLSGRIASELQAASGTLRSSSTLSGSLREIVATPSN